MSPSLTIERMRHLHDIEIPLSQDSRKALILTRESGRKCAHADRTTYDLTQAKVYLHGDGAPWIQAGLHYFPNCVFVLDRYHKNKALRQAVSALKAQDRKNYKSQLYLALCDGGKERFQSIAEEMLSDFPPVPARSRLFSTLSAIFDPPTSNPYRNVTPCESLTPLTAAQALG